MGLLCRDCLFIASYTFLIGKPPYETSDVKKTYKRIRNNDYTFPEHINIGDTARDLIKGILVLDPCKTPPLTVSQAIHI